MKISRMARNRALRDQIRLARLVDQIGDLAHRPVHGKVLQLPEDHQAEQNAQRRHPAGRRRAASGRHSHPRPPGPRSGSTRLASPPGRRSRCLLAACAGSRLRQRGGRRRQHQQQRHPVAIRAAIRPNPFITVSTPLIMRSPFGQPTTCLQSDRAATFRRSEKCECLPRRSGRGKIARARGYICTSPRYR